MNTKDLIYNYVVNETQSIKNDDFSLLTTTVICEELHISRSLASQYLNELFKEDKLIKISSRPVYYLDKNSIMKVYKVKNLSAEYLSYEELLGYLKEVTNKNGFKEAIGFDGSLSLTIQQIISAIMYGDNGLPILLFGREGSGKHYLSKLVYKFCIGNSLLPLKCKYKHVKCLANSSDYDEVLFGSHNKVGLLERKDLGVLYIDGINELSSTIQYKISSLLKDGFYLKDGVVIKPTTRIVMSTTQEPSDNLDNSLIQSLPIISFVPEFAQRGMDEKEEFIVKFFNLEEEKLNIPIEISTRLLEALLQWVVDKNIHELEKCITSICASALTESNKEILKCYTYHLPEAQFQFVDLTKTGQKETMIKVDTHVVNETGTLIIQMFDGMLESFQQYRLNAINQVDLFESSYSFMRDYYEVIVFQQSYPSQKIQAIEKTIDHILGVKKSLHNITIPSNCSFVLARMLLASLQQQSLISRWNSQKKSEITMFLEFLKEEMYEIFMLSKEISKQIYQTVELSLSDFELVFLMLNIYFYNDSIQQRDTAVIVVSHGYSTASSIADATNQLLEEHIFDAFDMPLDSSSEEIIQHVNDFITMNPYYKNLILLVDMGSLEMIGDKIIADINVGVLNNISTSIAIHIGTMVRQGIPMESLLKRAAESAQMKYKILNKAEKEKAILFVSDASISVANRMVNLFKHSLPKTIDLKFIGYDYKELLAKGIDDQVFRKYDVILMIKPYALKIGDIQSVSLEDIVSFKDIYVVDNALQNYLNNDEIEIFNRNLLKNFSLQNVMQNLTILNANKLLDYVSDATLQLERKMDKKFQSKTIIGIYIHVCFLVERLVTKTAIESYEGVEKFEQENGAFIKDVNESFGELLTHYNVQMPISEIALLYDYIVNDKYRQKGEGEEF